MLQPLLTLETAQSLQNSLRADTVRTVRIGKIARKIYLMRLDLLQKVDDDLDILIRTLPFLIPPVS